MIRDFFLGFVRIHILHHAAAQPVYGLWLITELGRHGYALSPGTLYPVLRGLANGGYLRLERRLVDGRVRKYYSITAGGRRALAAACAQLRELVGEVLESSAPPASRTLPSRPGVRRSRSATGVKRR